MAVLSLTWKSPYVDKTVFILRRGPDISNICMIACCCTWNNGKSHTSPRTTKTKHQLLIHRGHFGYAPSQCETMLQYNVIFHWLGAFIKWSFIHTSPRWIGFVLLTVGNANNIQTWQYPTDGLFFAVLYGRLSANTMQIPVFWEAKVIFRMNE